MARVVAVRVNAPTRNNEIRKSVFIRKVGNAIRWVLMEAKARMDSDMQQEHVKMTNSEALKSGLLKGEYKCISGMQRAECKVSELTKRTSQFSGWCGLQTRKHIRTEPANQSIAHMTEK